MINDETQVRIPQFPQTDVAAPPLPVDQPKNDEQAAFFRDMTASVAATVAQVMAAVAAAPAPAAKTPSAEEAFAAELVKMGKQLEALEARARLTRSPAAAELVLHKDSLAVHVSGWRLAGYVAGFGAIVLVGGLLWYFCKEAGFTVIKRYFGTV